MQVNFNLREFVMGNNMSEEEKKKEQKEYEKTRREKRAGFFYNLGQLSFAALVLGGLMPLISSEKTIASIITIILGGCSTYIFGQIADKTLKK